MAIISFYNTNSKELIRKYDNADMLSLHKLLLKYIYKNSTVLDIGFGSGRDLDFLQSHGYDIWGIDPSEKFVTNAKQRFSTIQEQFIEACVPFDKNSIGLSRKFDAIISIAIWMHLKHTQYTDAIKSIVSVAKDDSTILISYSEGSRIGDERYFEDVDLEYMTQLFKDKGFSLIETVTTGDSLDRDTLTWITVIYQHD